MSEIRDTVTGETLSTFSGVLADGRTFTVNARDEDTARALAREQGGGVSVMSIEAHDAETSDDDESSETEEKLTGDALHARAAELDIEGRSGMTADELREAIAAKESESDDDEEDGPVFS